MKVICVDEEKDTLFKTMTLLKGIPEISAVVGFFSGKAALQYLKNGEKADITLVDTDISAAGGLDLVKTLRTKYPDISIIITSENNDYAVEAFSMHVSGYILKPLNKRVLSKEIAFCVTQRDERIDNRRGGINVRTFGNFDISVDGVTVSFTRSKAKELLAYLVDRQGGSVTRREAFSILWEDREYDRSMQKQLDVVIRDLRSTLREYNIEEIFELQRGNMKIDPDAFDCDLYRFFKGDVDAINSFRGEYMSAYSWASITESYMDGLGK
ncbi:MAG: response regulator [Lachnospiraceae bacterium]|nr:response regulator [Lachnospiraceae bacterium]